MRILSKTNQAANGFTVMELAVVIVVIGILASITVVGYGAWHTSVAQKQVQSDLKQAKAAMQNASTFSDGFPLSVPSTFTASKDVQITYASGSTTAFCLNGTSTVVSGVNYYINQDSDPQTGTC